MPLLKQNGLLFLLLLLVVTVLVSYYLSSPSIKIKEIIPPDKSIDVPTDQVITITFAGDIQRNQIEVILFPQAQTREEIKQNTLSLLPQPSLNLATTYTVTIKDKKKNQEILKTIFDTVSPQGSPGVVEEAKKIQEENFPLASFSPPDSALFYFTYTGHRQLKVFLKGNQQPAKEEFLKWVKSLGIDLSGHQISFLSPP